jgi:hypothetical protein
VRSWEKEKVLSRMSCISGPSFGEEVYSNMGDIDAMYCTIRAEISRGTRNGRETAARCVKKSLPVVKKYVNI